MSLPRPTALGVKAALFYLLMLVAFYAAHYSNLFFLLLVFLGVLAAFALWSGRRNLANVTGRVAGIESTPAGVGAPVLVELAAPGRPRFGLVVELRFADGTIARVPVAMLRGAGTFRGRLPALPRGCYALRAATLTTAWPFGIFAFRRPLPCPAQAVVYPAPVESTGAPDGRGGAGEMLALHGAAGSMQPSHLREHRPGDGLRRVHWKASARRGALVVQEWESGSGTGLEVVLDRRAPVERFEPALSMLSALALAARETKDSLTLHTQGLRATYGGRHEPWDACFLFLARAEAMPANGAPPPAAGPHVPRLGGAA